jgi:hypothetical protein
MEWFLDDLRQRFVEHPMGHASDAAKLEMTREIEADASRTLDA